VTTAQRCWVLLLPPTKPFERMGRSAHSVRQVYSGPAAAGTDSLGQLSAACVPELSPHGQSLERLVDNSVCARESTGGASAIAFLLRAPNPGDPQRGRGPL